MPPTKPPRLRGFSFFCSTYLISECPRVLARVTTHKTEISLRYGRAPSKTDGAKSRGYDLLARGDLSPRPLLVKASAHALF